jgi:glycosyltransferase involved in cell wall biosynthesis
MNNINHEHIPFFSVVIPTRGRPHLLRDAIISALHQDFNDFEVIISDNFNEQPTRDVVNEFRYDNKIKYIRTERLLSMPEHWEFATRHATGHYVLILSDRSVLKKHALKTIYQAISSADQPVNVCSWRWSAWDDVLQLEFPITLTRPGVINPLPSKRIAKHFVDGNSDFYFTLPRGLNSCYRRNFYDSLREHYAEIFKPISPDFTSAFTFLAHSEMVLHIKEALFISQGLTVSNGLNAYTTTASDYLRSLGDRDWFCNVPIKAPLVENTIFQDYLSVQAMAKGEIASININWVTYFVRCYLELQEKKAAGLMAASQANDLFEQWVRALNEFDDSTKADVRRSLTQMRFKNLKLHLKYSIIGPFVRRLKRQVGSAFMMGPQIWRKRSVLEAAGFRREVSNHAILA